MKCNEYEYQYPACREDKRLPPPVHHGLPFLCFSVARGSPGRSMGSKSRISRFMRLLFGKKHFNGIPHVFPHGSPIVFGDHCIFPMWIPEVSHGMCQAHVGCGSSESRWIMGYPAENLGVPMLSPTEEGEQVESQRYFWSHFVILVLFLCLGAVFSQRSVLVGESIFGTQWFVVMVPFPMKIAILDLDHFGVWDKLIKHGRHVVQRAGVCVRCFSAAAEDRRAMCGDLS
jgi:hypothetical protein